MVSKNVGKEAFIGVAFMFVAIVVIVAVAGSIGKMDKTFRSAE